MELYAWKFLIRSGREISDPAEEGLSYVGPFNAVALATDEAQARAVLEGYARENGLDSRWLRVATVMRLSITQPGMVSWTSA